MNQLSFFRMIVQDVEVQKSDEPPLLGDVVLRVTEEDTGQGLDRLSGV